MKFSELQGIDCLIEKYPLEKANEAYGKCLAALIFLLLATNTQLSTDAMLNGSVRFRAVLTFE